MQQSMLSQISPLPLQPVPAPPWSNYNTRVSIHRSMKKKLGHMDTELYPPGQNPGYFNPWVTMPYPTTPAPNTPQYGGPWPTAMPRKELPHHIQHGGWVQVQLKNKIDTERDTLADKLQGDISKWYYAQLDSWFLSFYQSTPGSIRKRVSSIDLRLVRRTQTVSQVLGNVVILILESGSFEFVVRPEEAQAWCAAITAAILAWAQLRETKEAKEAQPSAPFAKPSPSAPHGVSPRGLGSFWSSSSADAFATGEACLGCLRQSSGTGVSSSDRGVRGHFHAVWCRWERHFIPTRNSNNAHGLAAD